MRLVISALLVIVTVVTVSVYAEVAPESTAQYSIKPEKLSVKVQWDQDNLEFVVPTTLQYGVGVAGANAGFELWITVQVFDEDGAATTAPECLVWNFDNTEVKGTPGSTVELSPSPRVAWPAGVSFSGTATIDATVMLASAGGQIIDETFAVTEADIDVHY